MPVIFNIANTLLNLLPGILYYVVKLKQNKTKQKNPGPFALVITKMVPKLAEWGIGQSGL